MKICMMASYGMANSLVNAFCKIFNILSISMTSIFTTLVNLKIQNAGKLSENIMGTRLHPVSNSLFQRGLEMWLRINERYKAKIQTSHFENIEGICREAHKKSYIGQLMADAIKMPEQPFSHEPNLPHFII